MDDAVSHIPTSLVKQPQGSPNWDRTIKKSRLPPALYNVDEIYLGTPLFP